MEPSIKHLADLVVEIEHHLTHADRLKLWPAETTKTEEVMLGFVQDIAITLRMMLHYSVETDAYRLGVKGN